MRTTRRVTGFEVDKNVNPFSTGMDSINADSTLQLLIFARLWAIASLFHMAHSSVFDTQLNFALLTLAAMYVIFRPSLYSLLILSVLQLFDALFRMPFTTNHWIFSAFVSATIIYAWIFAVVKERTFQVDGGQVLKAFAPAVRIEVIVLYFFAVFHKLNSGFFSPAESCASELLLAQQVDAFIPLSPELLKWNAYFTIIVESLIPLMLCFRKTRFGGIVIGLIFHGFLSYSTYNAFYDFSSMVFAVYFLFTAPSFSKVIYERYHELKNEAIRWFAPQAFEWKRLMVIVGIAVVALAVLAVLNKKLDDFKSVHLYFFWTLYSVIVLYWIIRFGWKSQSEQQVSFKMLHWTFALIPVAVFLNGWSPYIGLKTENSYAMFSNLRTEDGVSNHFIVPASVQLFDYQRHVVDISSSTDPYLQKLSTANKSMVLFEFRNYIHERRPEKVLFLYEGKSYTYQRGDKTSGTLLQANSPILAKLMKFRPFERSGEQPCAH